MPERSNTMNPLPPVADTYVRTINAHDPAAFMALFADDAVVEDVGRVIRGLNEIRAWSAREIFAAQVTLDVVNVINRGDETIVAAKVDGTFDRTGLPNPLILEHAITIQNEKISHLVCRLAKETPHA
jgi:uncharacterized protein (TIGR02246 family)